MSTTIKQRYDWAKTVIDPLYMSGSIDCQMVDRLVADIESALAAFEKAASHRTMTDLSDAVQRLVNEANMHVTVGGGVPVPPVATPASPASPSPAPAPQPAPAAPAANPAPTDDNQAPAWFTAGMQPLQKAVANAHERVDGHELRLTAAEDKIATLEKRGGTASQFNGLASVVFGILGALVMLWATTFGEFSDLVKALSVAAAGLLAAYAGGTYWPRKKS